MTLLPDLPADPEPRPTDLEPFLAEWSFTSPDVQLRGARLSWQMALQKQDPNSFLVPFISFLQLLVPGFDYNAYRKSPLWRFIRTKVLSEAAHRCAGCSGRATQVHHRDYRPRVMSGEDLTPLVPLCKTCHEHVEEVRKKVGWHAGEAVLAKLVERQSPASTGGA